MIGSGDERLEEQSKSNILICVWEGKKMGLSKVLLIVPPFVFAFVVILFA